MKIDYVIGSDWEGLYINDKLAEEQHHMNMFDALKCIAEQWKDGDKFIVSEYEIEFEWLEDRGDLPENFSDIPKRKINKFREIKI